MREIGLLEQKSGRAREDRSYPMDHSMKVGGQIIKLTGKVGSLTLMATFMMANGLMIRHTASVYILILMERSMKDTGKRISSMDTGRRPGLMERDIKGSTSME